MIYKNFQDMQSIENLPGESSEDKIVSFLKIKTVNNVYLRHQSIRENVEKFGIFYKAADEDEGGLLGFNPSKYPDINLVSLKEKYKKIISANIKVWWDEKDFDNEMQYCSGGGYKGFGWGDPDY